MQIVNVLTWPVQLVAQITLALTPNAAAIVIVLLINTVTTPFVLLDAMNIQIVEILTVHFVELTINVLIRSVVKIVNAWIWLAQPVLQTIPVSTLNAAVMMIVLLINTVTTTSVLLDATKILIVEIQTARSVEPTINVLILSVVKTVNAWTWHAQPVLRTIPVSTLNAAVMMIVTQQLLFVLITTSVLKAAEAMRVVQDIMPYVIQTTATVTIAT